MSAHFTLGIEEEFQIVDRRTGQLSPSILTIIEKGAPYFGSKIKPEMLQSTIELITDVLPNIAAVRLELQTLRAKLAQLVASEGLALVSAGTHPGALWSDQPSTPNPRYAELEEEFQDVGRAILIFALHVHIGIESKEVALSVMNQARTWIPHLLALSSNSPFWAGRFTGLRSYRSIVWRTFHRSGISDSFASWTDCERYVQALISSECIDNAKKIWWDIRPHPFFNTLEFRVFDMPATMEDTLALVALCQALVAKLTWLHKHNMGTYVLPRNLIEENKWRAMRYGLDAQVIDFVQSRRLSMRESISELLDFVDDVLDDLGSHCEIHHLRMLLEDPRGTGADRQIAVYQQTRSVKAVIDFLMEQTMEGIRLDAAEQSLAG